MEALGPDLSHWFVVSVRANQIPPEAHLTPIKSEKKQLPPPASILRHFIILSRNHPHDGAAGFTAERSSIPHCVLLHQNTVAHSPPLSRPHPKPEAWAGITINHPEEGRRADQLSCGERAMIEHLSESERV